jgi:hypothetical protein
MTDRVKKMVDLVRECKEKGIRPSGEFADELKSMGLWSFPIIKVRLSKDELAGMTEEELQEMLNKYKEAGLIPPETTLDDIDVWESDIV